MTTPAVMISLSCTARTLPEHGPGSSSRTTPVVPLEAGAGPENPPCPACGEPLFGWIDQRPGLAGPVQPLRELRARRGRRTGGAEEALRELDRLRDGETMRIANRGGFAAWIGGAGWAGPGAGGRYLFTVEAVRRLVARRDQVVSTARWAPGRGHRDDVADGPQRLHLRPQRRPRRPAAARRRGRRQKPWQRRLDALISVVVAIPACWSPSRWS